LIHTLQSVDQNCSSPKNQQMPDQSKITGSRLTPNIIFLFERITFRAMAESILSQTGASRAQENGAPDPHDEKEN
jgi:hypothetical protein